MSFVYAKQTSAMLINQSGGTRFVMVQFNKNPVIIASIAVLVVLSSITLVSFSQSPLQDISEKMSFSSGPTTIKISGESTSSIPKDGARLAVNIMTKPTDLNNLEEQRKAQVDKVINSIKDTLGQNATITIGYTNYNPQWYNNSPDMSSISAHVEIPIKTGIENIANVTKVIAEKGFWTSNLQIKKEPKTNQDAGSQSNSVGISLNSSIPGCEQTNECFAPYNKAVTVGQSVSWKNLDSAAHTVTSGKPRDGPNGVFDSGLFNSGATFQFTFGSAGEYDYFCMVHPWMEGIVTVIEDKSKMPDTPIEYVYVASMNAVIDLPPDDTSNSIAKYQEKVKELNDALSAYQLEDANTKQGTVNFNPTYWPSSTSNIFTSQTQLLIDTDYNNLKSILKILKDSGVNFESYSLSYSPESLESVRKNLTQKAIENAKERALEIISPMNLQIKGIKSIEVRSGESSNPYGGVPVYSHGVMLSAPFYDPNQSSATVIADIEFEVGK